LSRERAGDRLLLLANFSAESQEVESERVLGPYEYRWISEP
jgi:hypothetical protein